VSLHSRAAHVLAAIAVASATACTPAVSRLEPYDRDAVAAQELDRRAAATCIQQRGASALPPHRFTTDGCSLWPDGDWVECCVDHDMAYWCGGTCDDRARADAELRDCVAAHGHGGLGRAMYVGVRVGGPPWTPFPFRWGYGWDWPRCYDPPLGTAP
jgi:hypothetical protein